MEFSFFQPTSDLSSQLQFLSEARARGLVRWSDLVGDCCSLWLHQDQPVARHDSDELRNVGRPACVYDGRDVPKVLRPDVGRKNDKCSSRGLVWVAELMDRSARRKHPLSWSKIPYYSVY